MWNDAETAGSIIDLGTGYEVYDDTPEGVAFINAWTGSTIEGVSGGTKANSNWWIFFGTDVQITGGTYFSGSSELDLFNSTGGTITITGFTDYYTTGFTFNPASYDLTIKRNDGLPDLSVNLSISIGIKNQL